jgi:hypothetical protein
MTFDCRQAGAVFGLQAGAVFGLQPAAGFAEGKNTELTIQGI